MILIKKVNKEKKKSIRIAKFDRYRAKCSLKQPLKECLGSVYQKSYFNHKRDHNNLNTTLVLTSCYQAN